MEGQFSLPTEPALEQHIRKTAQKDALPHGIILSGNGDTFGAAQLVAAAMECTGDYPPCGQCIHCKKILRGVHPDVIQVEDSEHKNIATEVLRQVRSDAYLLPNEGQRKIYLFADSSRLDSRSQNVLLKVLEEGPPRTAFIFCAENSSILLPTIRSRCVEWRLRSGQAAVSPSAEAQQLMKLLLSADRAGIAGFFCRLENRKPEREELQQLFSALRESLVNMLTGRQTAPFSSAGIACLLEQVERLAGQCNLNLNIGQLSGAAMVVCHRFLEAESHKKGGVCS